MVLVAVLTTAIACFHALGLWAGVSLWSSWQDASRWGIAVMLLFAASAHFNSMRHELAQMIPPPLPNPPLIVRLTGLCEIIGAVGLVIPATQRIAALCIIAFFLVVLPANIYGATMKSTLGGRPVTPLWLRLPMQAIFIGLTWWSALA